MTLFRIRLSGGVVIAMEIFLGPVLALAAGVLILVQQAGR